MKSTQYSTAFASPYQGPGDEGECQIPSRRIFSAPSRKATEVGTIPADTNGRNPGNTVMKEKHYCQRAVENIFLALFDVSPGNSKFDGKPVSMARLQYCTIADRRRGLETIVC